MKDKPVVALATPEPRVKRRANGVIRVKASSVAEAYSIATDFTNS